MTTETNETTTTTMTATTMTEQWVPVDNGQVRVRRWRPPGAPPVLFVHGAFVNGHFWDGMVDALLATGPPLDLIVPDLPIGGHHRPMAPGTVLTFDIMVELIIDLLDALDVERAVVVANDSGGAITQYLLVKHPERFSGVLLTSTETARNFPPTYFRHLFPPLRLRAFMWSTCQILRTNFGRRLPITFGHLVKRRMTSQETETLMGPLFRSAGVRDDVRRFLAAADIQKMRDAEARRGVITAPVDVAWAADDPVFPDAEGTRLADSFPNGRRVADITDSGSLSPYDQPGQVAARLIDLVSRVSAASD